MSFKFCIIIASKDAEAKGSFEVDYHGFTQDGWEEIPAESPAEARHFCDAVTTRAAVRAEVLTFFHQLTHEEGAMSAAEFAAATTAVLEWDCGSTLAFDAKDAMLVLLPLEW